METKGYEEEPASGQVLRRQFRGCLKDGTENTEEWNTACREAETLIRQSIREGRLLTASLYRYQNMLFLYYEALNKEVMPEDFLSPLAPFLETWPEESGKREWAAMYAIYWHSVPKETAAWEAARCGAKQRIGRIAFVHPEKLFSYTYWHQAIVEEGLLKGDQYQFISLHENILFSYFEEPKHLVNIRGSEEESRVIGDWLKADPESHFDRVKAGGSNFRIIEAVLSAGTAEAFESRGIRKRKVPEEF
ncbi:MAG: hypothetical protein Q4F29_05510 [Lachnospiraceae bacterium]|nr:hypothetical protein [Lachnospiraceae bacterium]